MAKTAKKKAKTQKKKKKATKKKNVTERRSSAKKPAKKKAAKKKKSTAKKTSKKSKKAKKRASKKVETDKVYEPEIVETPAVVEPEPAEEEALSQESTKALSTVDAMGKYLAEIQKYPLLSRDEEFFLAKQYYDDKDPQAAEKLVTSNLRFVVKIAAEYSKFGAKLIDLVQEGNVGLMHAVREFNPYKGVRLITYAVWWIRGYIQEYLMRQYSMVRIGTTQAQRKLFYQLQKQKEELDKLGPEESVALLSGRLGVREKDVRSMQQRMSGRDVSLNSPVSEGDTTTLLDFQSDHTEEAIDEMMGLKEELSILEEKIEQLRPELSDRERELLEKRILTDEPMTLQEIGEQYGITREAVRQMEARLLDKIKSAVQKDL